MRLFKPEVEAQRFWNPYTQTMPRAELDRLHLRKLQTLIEYANREMAELDLFKEYPPNREVGVGIVDVKAYQVESPEEVARRIRAALQWVPAERLWISPDCGFWEAPRHVAVGKMRAMVAGTRIVRKELGTR